MSIPNIPVPDEDGSEEQLLAVAIAALPGLPQPARDAVWRSPAITAWKPPKRCPFPPSDSVARDLLAAAEDDHLKVLAVALRNGRMLDELVQTRATQATLTNAVRNPFLLRETQAQLAADPDTADLVASRIAASATADAFVAGRSSETAADVALALIEAREAHTCATIMTSNDPAAAPLAEALVERFVEAKWGTEGSSAQLVRGAVLELLTEIAPAVVREIGVKVARNHYTPIDPGVVLAVNAALEAGDITVDDVVARLDADAANWLAHLDGPLASMLPDEDLQLPVKRTDRLRYLADMGRAADDAEMLALLGLSSVSARTALAATEPMSDEKLVSTLADADIETVFDYFERRLNQKPTAKQVATLGEMILDGREKEFEAEFALRPEPLELSPALVLCVPGIARRQVPPAAARIARAHLQHHLGTRQGAWTLAVALMSDGNDNSLLSLTQLADVVDDGEDIDIMALLSS